MLVHKITWILNISRGFWPIRMLVVQFIIIKGMRHNLELLSFQKMYGLLRFIRKLKALQRSAHGLSWRVTDTLIRDHVRQPSSQGLSSSSPPPQSSTPLSLSLPLVLGGRKKRDTGDKVLWRDELGRVSCWRGFKSLFTSALMLPSFYKFIFLQGRTLGLYLFQGNKGFWD